MKQCPSCGKIRPDTAVFCAEDGSRLHPVSKTNRPFRKRILVSAAIIISLGIILLNGFPYVLKWAASNFKVSLVGISCEKDSISGVLARQTRQILEDFLGVIVAGENKPGKVDPPDFTILLEVENNSFFPVKINSVQFKLLVNDRNVGKGALLGDESVSIGAFEKKRISCPLTLHSMPILESAGKIMASGRLRYGVQGQVVGVFLLWKITCPFDVKGLTIQL